MSELKPCPFCGGTELVLKNMAGWEIDCPCGINLCHHHERAKVISQWNTRAESPELAALRAENAALRSANQTLKAELGASILRRATTYCSNSARSSMLSSNPSMWDVTEYYELGMGQLLILLAQYEFNTAPESPKPVE